MSRLGPVLAVAGLAFRESARNRVLHALVGATLLMAGVSVVFAWVSGDEPTRQLKVVADLSLSAIALLGTIASIFLGTNLVFQEVERRTVYTVLARPLDRGGFIVGKYLGLAGVMAVAVAAMSLGFLLVYALAGGRPSAGLLLALLLTYVELAVVIGVAVFFSVAAHPIEGAVFAFVVALAGHVTADLNRLGAELTREVGGLGAALLEGALYGAYVLLPNLENFNLRAHAAHGVPIDPGHVGLALVYAAVYVAVLLGLATLVFRRKVL
ncbi:MAG: ABC transporter permease [Planctomycetes bacterium]|nr:ABC transporter permease [Planctomycetota bacterium]